MLLEYHIKIPLPFSVYADFKRINQPTDNPNNLFKQIPSAVGYQSLQI